MGKVDCFSNVVKQYETVDLGTYHYLVVQLDEKMVPFSIMLNDVGLPIAYTTGTRAVDLRNFAYDSLRGKQAVKVRMQFLNTGGAMRIRSLRLVSELTADEKKGLIAPGYLLQDEKLQPNQAQGLDAVIQRVDRPRMDAYAGEQLCFRDTATGAVIWRLTGNMSGATVVSDSVHAVYNASGSHMLILSQSQGPVLYDLQKQTWTPCPFAGISRFSPREADILWAIESTQKPPGMRFHKFNIRTNVDEVAGQIEFDRSKYPSPVTELGFSSDTDMVAVGLRETPCVLLFDPSKPAAERVRTITLPMRLKGMGLSPDGKRLGFNRCYWYESWEMDLETGKTQLAMTGGGSHAGGGGGLRLSHYEGSIVAYPEGISHGKPGDEAKVLLNYRQGWSTDYGLLSSDRSWYAANGWEGDMHGKLILANVNEPGTVFHVAQQNTSRDDWYNNTVVRASPDCTKLAWTSDLWGYNAVCVTYTRQIEPPTDLTGKRDGNDVALTWTRSMLRNDLRGRSPAELAGYNVYRSRNGGPFVPLNKELIPSPSYRDEDAPKDAVLRYVAVSQERSGVEGTTSNEFVLMPVVVDREVRPSQTQHLEAELCWQTPPARAAFSGWTSGWQYVRLRKALETESLGVVWRNVSVQFPGEHRLFVRVRAEGKGGKWQVKLDDKPAGQVAVEGVDWKWLALDAPLTLADEKPHRLAFESADEGLCLDKFILTSDLKYAPKELDDRFAAPKKLQHLVAAETTQSSVRLAWWNPTAETDLDYYNIYVGAEEGFPCDQAHRIASVRGSECLDWGLAPGKSYTYKVTAVNRRGLESEPGVVTAKTLAVPQAVLLSLPIAKAHLDPRLTKETKDKVEYAFLPDQGEAKQKDPPADIAWEFDVPADGQYSVWCRYAPGDAYPSWHNVPILLDNLLDGKATWKMRTPFRQMSGTNYLVWPKDLWFSDRISMYVWPRPLDVFRLTAGKHKLALRLVPGIREFSHKISEVWVTNDTSWRPPGWDPQANFTKSQVRQKAK